MYRSNLWSDVFHEDLTVNSQGSMKSQSRSRFSYLSTQTSPSSTGLNFRWPTTWLRFGVACISNRAPPVGSVPRDGSVFLIVAPPRDPCLAVTADRTERRATRFARALLFVPYLTTRPAPDPLPLSSVASCKAYMPVDNELSNKIKIARISKCIINFYHRSTTKNLTHSSRFPESGSRSKVEFFCPLISSRTTTPKLKTSAFLERLPCMRYSGAM